MVLTTQERDELRATARTLLERESPPARVRGVVAAEPGYDPDLWDRMVELGWIGIHHDERVGGAGCGHADLAVVLHELGRALVPLPFLASAVLASGALAMADDEALGSDLLARLVGGEARGAVVLAGASGSYEPAQRTTTWRSAGGEVRLDGAAGFVLDADIADVLVVAARADDGTAAAIAVDRSAPGVRVERAATVDATRRLCTVAFDDVAVKDERLLREPGGRSDELIDRVLSLGVIAAACDATGVAELALERAAAYARERTQFGKPIGSFQAVKHHCADMAVAVEASRAATRAAVEALDGDPTGWATAAAITSSYVGPACSRVGALAVLVHGGIGFTWEHDVHLYLERLKLDELLFGTPAWHRRRLADTAFPTFPTAPTVEVHR
jgi:acyl-CoA dehydrogenase